MTSRLFLSFSRGSRSDGPRTLVPLDRRVHRAAQFHGGDLARVGMRLPRDSMALSISDRERVELESLEEFHL